MLKRQLGFSAWKRASPVLLQREMESMKRTKVVWLLFPSDSDFKCLSREELNNSLQPGLLASLCYTQAERCGEQAGASLQLIYRDTGDM